MRWVLIIAGAYLGAGVIYELVSNRWTGFTWTDRAMGAVVWPLNAAGVSIFQG